MIFFLGKGFNYSVSPRHVNLHHRWSNVFHVLPTAQVMYRRRKHNIFL